MLSIAPAVDLGPVDGVLGCEARADRLHEMIECDRFSEHARSVHGLWARCHDHDGDVARVRSRGDLLLHDVAVEARQNEIQHDDIGGTLINRAQSRQAVGSFLNLESGHRQGRPEHPAKILVIFDN